jgi:hypothetical protein
VLALTKVLIDSLNEAEIDKSIGGAPPEAKGISKLESFLKAESFQDVDAHIKFLRDVQALRSSGTGHRKGSKYKKVSSSFGVGEGELRAVFEDILKRVCRFLRALAEHVRE